jgi:hypothetical protein
VTPCFETANHSVSVKIAGETDIDRVDLIDMRK